MAAQSASGTVGGSVYEARVDHADMGHSSQGRGWRLLARILQGA